MVLMQPISFPSNLPANVKICLEVANGNMLLNSLDLIVSKSIECHKQPLYVMQCNAVDGAVLYRWVTQLHENHNLFHYSGYWMLSFMMFTNAEHVVTQRAFAVIRRKFKIISLVLAMCSSSILLKASVIWIHLAKEKERKGWSTNGNDSRLVVVIALPFSINVNIITLCCGKIASHLISRFFSSVCSHLSRLSDDWSASC